VHVGDQPQRSGTSLFERTITMPNGGYPIWMLLNLTADYALRFKASEAWRSARFMNEAIEPWKFTNGWCQFDY
jgi:hypothetical protein